MPYEEQQKNLKLLWAEFGGISKEEKLVIDSESEDEKGALRSEDTMIGETELQEGEARTREDFEDEVDSKEKSEVPI